MSARDVDAMSSSGSSTPWTPPPAPSCSTRHPIPATIEPFSPSLATRPVLRRRFSSSTQLRPQRSTLTRHRGAHPRIGAVDVVPFVPLRHASVADCVSLANSLGRLVAERFNIPVFLYEDAATRPERQALENIRRGQLEGLTRRMALPEWRPDFGPPTPHPTAGASAIGVRQVLIAFNVNLDTDDVEIAHQIARTVRSRNGGLAHLKAIGIRLGDHGQVQVSMNLTDYTKTPMHRVFNLVKREADKRGVSIANTEVVGLAPADALIASAVSYLRLSEFKSGQVLRRAAGGWLMGPSIRLPRRHDAKRAILR